MVRIRGTVGQWPVDLTLELDDSEWPGWARNCRVWNQGK